MANQSRELRELARALNTLDRRVRAIGSGGQLAQSSIEDGAVQAYDRYGSQVLQIGKQWDGTYAPNALNGPTPPTPSGLTVTDATEGLVIAWDGTFLGGVVPAPMNFLRVDAHIGAVDSFTPDHTNRVASFVSPQGGSLGVTVPYGTYFVKLVCWTLAGKVSAASTPVEGDSWPVEVSSDGFAPASSPTPEVIGGLDVLLVRWPAIINADPVRYQVHISTSASFVPDSSTLVATVTGTQLTVKALPGPGPVNPGDPDLRLLQYYTPYYVRIIAEDDDGEAAPGGVGVDEVYQITGENVSAATIRGNHIIGGEITGDKFASVLSISSAFWTSLTGQRAGFTPDGFFAFRPDDSPIFRIPTDGSNAFLDAEMILRGATVTGGLSIQSSQNELTADSAMTLMRGIVAPSATPQFVHDYEKLQPSTASLSTADKTGFMGTFDLVPSEVSQIEHKGYYWVIHQIRTNGTRSWFFDLAGNPTAPAGFYFDDHHNWQIYSTITLSGSSVPARDGVYTIFRWIPDGTWYLSHPTSIARYSLRNATQTPVLGCNADDIFVAEVLTTGSLQLNFVRPVASNDDVPAPFSVRSTPVSTYNKDIQLTAVQWRSGGYGTGAARYMVTQRGNGLTNLLVNGSAGGSQILYPGGSGDNWASANKDAESFECPTSQRRGAAYDGTNFWTYGSDGYLYKHTNEVWDPAVTSSKVWGRVTLYDSDAGGTGLHETTPGPAISFNYNRRARLKATLPTPPDNGGVDDPDSIRLYVGRGSSSPANASMWLQYTGLGPTTFTTLTSSGSNPPTVNGFPASNPAVVKNDDASLYFKGDGSSRLVTGKAKKGPVGGIDEELAVEGPYWFGYLAAAKNGTTGVNTVLDTLTVGDPIGGGTGSYGITYGGSGSGVFTLPRAGWYDINVVGVWAVGGVAGARELYIYRGASGGNQVAWAGAPPHASISPMTRIHRKLYFPAGALTFRIIFMQSSGGTTGLIGDSGAGTTAGRYTHVNIEWDRP